MRAAKSARSTSAASGVLRVCTRKISCRAAASGSGTSSSRSNLPGLSSAGSTLSGRLVAASTTTPRRGCGRAGDRIGIQGTRKGKALQSSAMSQHKHHNTQAGLQQGRRGDSEGGASGRKEAQSRAVHEALTSSSLDACLRMLHSLQGGAGQGQHTNKAFQTFKTA